MSAEEMTPLLQVAGLGRRFGGLRAVEDVSFSVAPQTIKAVIGPNGAGKTTLFNLIAGALRSDTGEIRLNGRRTDRCAPHQIAALGVARTFQNLRLFPGLTVLENVLLGCHTCGRAGFWAGALRWPTTWSEERQLRERTILALERFGLTVHARTEAVRLSFGQQRSVELARALVGEPRLLLLDEPAAGLNMHETTLLATQIRALRQQGITVLLVEHDMSLVMDISDEIVVLNCGRKIAEGSPQVVQKNAEVIRVYLGEDDAHG
jgi:branched-chain amino acid transport system ATP-binding protein